MLVASIRRRRSPFVAILTATLLLAQAASAEPSGADKAIAETMFRAARELMTSGKVAEACERFAESQRLDPKLGTLLNLALCHEQQNKTASAWGEFIDAAGQARNANQPDREQFARSHAAALEPNLSRLVISFVARADLKITIDGFPLGGATAGAPLPIDPGDHVVAAEAPGKKRWEARVTVPPGPAKTQVQIPNLEDATTLPVAPAIVPPFVAVAVPPPAPPPGMSKGRVAGLVIGSLGLAGLVVGGVTGGLAFSREAEAKKVCPDTACPTQAGLDLHNRASGFATASTIAFIAGGVAAAGGVVLFVVSRDEAAPASAFIAPSFAPGLGGIVAGGRF